MDLDFTKLYEQLNEKYIKLRDFKELKYSKSKDKVEVNLNFVLRDL